VFGWHVDIFEDRVHGTHDLALLAVDADVRIDVRKAWVLVSLTMETYTFSPPNWRG
jgi:hypothetical protein